MDAPLEKNQAVTVGNLLREHTRTDLACFEASLVTDAHLACSITNQDLDRLITASPDLLRWLLSGSDINRMRRIEAVQWIGLDAKPGIIGREIYSVVLTENAYALITEALGGGGGLPKPEYLFMSVVEAITEQLSTRKPRTYEFKSLGLRWRRFGEVSTEVSAQSMGVRNPYGIEALSGVSYESYSNWNINLQVPLSIYNAWNRFDLLANIDYSSSNSSIERNILEFKLDYGYNPNWAINAYASADYQTFIVKEPEIDMPVRIRTIAGAMAKPGEWTMKLGFGAEKIVSSSHHNPFQPFDAIFSGSGEERWDPSFEFSVQGSQSIADLLRFRGLGIPEEKTLDADVTWKNILSLPSEGSRFETRLTVELSADIIPDVNVKTGYDIFFARYLRDKRDFYNFNPSLSILGTYRFKW
jgi:hypothetical protein